MSRIVVLVADSKYREEMTSRDKSPMRQPLKRKGKEGEVTILA